MHHIYVSERGGVHIVDLLIEADTPPLAVKRAEAHYPGKVCRYIATHRGELRIIRMKKVRAG